MTIRKERALEAVLKGGCFKSDPFPVRVERSRGVANFMHAALIVAHRHPGDVDIARLPAVAVAPEDVGEADADAEGLARRAARPDRPGAREEGGLAAGPEDQKV